MSSVTRVSCQHKQMSEVKSLCTSCNATAANFTCSKCQFPHYCSRQCQLAHWPIHKEECKVWSDPFQNYQKRYPEHFMWALHEVSMESTKFLILQNGTYELRSLEQIAAHLQEKSPLFFQDVKAQHTSADGKVSVFILKNEKGKEKQTGDFYRLPANILNLTTTSL